MMLWPPRLMEKFWNSMMARVPRAPSDFRSPAKPGTAGMMIVMWKGREARCARRIRATIAAPSLLVTGRWASLVAVMKNWGVLGWRWSMEVRKEREECGEKGFKG